MNTEKSLNRIYALGPDFSIFCILPHQHSFFFIVMASYVWPKRERLTYSPMVKGILESEGKIAWGPRTPANTNIVLPSQQFKNEVQLKTKTKVSKGISKHLDFISNLDRILYIFSHCCRVFDNKYDVIFLSQLLIRYSGQRLEVN